MELEKVLSEIEISLFNEIILQLKKDIKMSGLDLLGDLNSPKDLSNSLLKLIQEENENPPQALMNLLYRVDVKELEIHQIAKRMNVSFEEAIAIGILNRTLKKVEFRKKFNK